MSAPTATAASTAPASNTSTLRPLLTLAPLFLGQDMLLTFLVFGLVTVLRTEGASLTTLAMVSAIPIIMAARFLWAPLVDRFGWRRIGHYTSWIAGSQSVVVVCCAVMAVLEPATGLGWVLGLIGLAMMAASVQDTASNAVIVRLYPPEVRSRLNGMIIAVIYLGILIGGGAFLVIYQYLGWSAAVGMIAAANALASLSVLALGRRERAAMALTPTPVDRPSLGAILSFFRQTSVVKWALVAIPLYVAGFYLASALVTPMLVDVGFAPAEVGAIQSGIGSVAGIIAALCSGFVTARIGRGRALTVFGLLRVVAICALVPLAFGETSALAVAAIVLMVVAETTAATVQLTVLMDACRPESPGTDYSLQAAVITLARTTAAPLALVLAAGIGYAPVLAIAGLATLLGTLAASRYRPRGMPPSRSVGPTGLEPMTSTV